MHRPNFRFSTSLGEFVKYPWTKRCRRQSERTPISRGCFWYLRSHIAGQERLRYEVPRTIDYRGKEAPCSATENDVWSPFVDMPQEGSSIALYARWQGSLLPERHCVTHASFAHTYLLIACTLRLRWCCTPSLKRPLLRRQLRRTLPLLWLYVWSIPGKRVRPVEALEARREPYRRSWRKRQMEQAIWICVSNMYVGCAGEPTSWCLPPSGMMGTKQKVNQSQVWIGCADQFPQLWHCAVVPSYPFKGLVKSLVPTTKKKAIAYRDNVD